MVEGHIHIIGTVKHVIFTVLTLRFWNVKFCCILSSRFPSVLLKGKLNFHVYLILWFKFHLCKNNMVCSICWGVPTSVHCSVLVLPKVWLSHPDFSCVTLTWFFRSQHISASFTVEKYRLERPVWLGLKKISLLPVAVRP